MSTTSGRQRLKPCTLRPVLFLQDACLQHQNIRSSQSVLERPERLRAVNFGIAATYARLEETIHNLKASKASNSRRAASNRDIDGADPLTIVRSTATVDSIMNHPAAHTILHIKREEDPNSPTYAEELEKWCSESRQKIVKGESEIPAGFEGDLYLCPKSFQAFKGAIGTVCEAVDSVAAASSTKHAGTRAFAAIRPPGHHAVSGRPAGLGFVNNVAIAAVHAFYQHGYTHIVIFDIDLHHGNGTQRIVQQINKQAHDQSQNESPGPVIYFGSIHDVKSYPYTSGDPDASEQSLLCMHGEDGQWLQNIRMSPFTSDEEFWSDYQERYRRLITTAEQFVRQTRAKKDKVMVLMSCGFSASQHEDPDMSRHGVYVPTSFYHRFTVDACAFADKFAQGRLVSILEGGYSDHALVSGTTAHIVGLAQTEALPIDPEWWSLASTEQVVQIMKKKPGRKAKLEKQPLPSWVQRTRQLAECLNEPLATNELSPIFQPPSFESLSKEGIIADPPVEPLRTSRRLRGMASTTDGPITSQATSSRPNSMRSGKNTPAHSRQDSGQCEPTSTTPVLPSSQIISTTSASIVLSYSSCSPSTSARQGKASTPVQSNKRPLAASNPDPERKRPRSSSSSLDATPLSNNYREVQDSFTEFSKVVEAATDVLPAELLRAMRPVKGCLSRLGRNLGDPQSVREAVDMLESLIEESHRACASVEDRDFARRLDRGLYDFEGAVFDLKNAAEAGKHTN